MHLLSSVQDVRLVMCTVPNAEVGEMIARASVAAGVAACVNVIPGLRSFYVWEGKPCDEPELLLLIKTTEANLGALAALVAEMHPYQVPELIALPVTAGSAPYLDWVRSSVSQP